MIEIKNELPKEYERVVLEEYYNLFKNMYGITFNPFRSERRFTTDREKLNEKDSVDPLMVSAIGALESLSIDENIKLLLYKEEDGRISSIARIRITPKSNIHIAEVIFLEYQSFAEKSNIIKEMINYLTDVASRIECLEVSIEVPDYDEDILHIILDNDLKKLEEKKSRFYHTKIYKRDIKKEHECTLSRKQGKR